MPPDRLTWLLASHRKRRKGGFHRESVIRTGPTFDPGTRCHTLILSGSGQGPERRYHLKVLGTVEGRQYYKDLWLEKSMAERDSPLAIDLVEEECRLSCRIKDFAGHRKDISRIRFHCRAPTDGGSWYSDPHVDLDGTGGMEYRVPAAVETWKVAISTKKGNFSFGPYRPGERPILELPEMFRVECRVSFTDPVLKEARRLLALVARSGESTRMCCPDASGRISLHLRRGRDHRFSLELIDFFVGKLMDLPAPAPEDKEVVDLGDYSLDGLVNVLCLTCTDLEDPMDLMKITFLPKRRVYYELEKSRIWIVSRPGEKFDLVASYKGRKRVVHRRHGKVALTFPTGEGER